MFSLKFFDQYKNGGFLLMWTQFKMNDFVFYSIENMDFPPVV